MISFVNATNPCFFVRLFLKERNDNKNLWLDLILTKVINDFFDISGQKYPTVKNDLVYKYLVCEGRRRLFFWHSSEQEQKYVKNYALLSMFTTQKENNRLALEPMNHHPLFRQILSRGLKDFHIVGFGFFQETLEVKGYEEDTFTLVELGIELNPVETQGVEEGGQTLHDHQDTDGHACPRRKDQED